MAALRVLHGAHALDWLASEDMLLFLAFMMATGVCIGTSIMLTLHTFLGENDALLTCLFWKVHFLMMNNVLKCAFFNINSVQWLHNAGVF